LLAAFVLVAMSSVAVLTGAALLGTSRGLAAAEAADRQQVAAEVAQLLGTAYARADGWSGVDVEEAAAAAAGARAHLTVEDQAGSVVISQGRGRRTGMSGGTAGVQAAVPVIVDGTTVGTVTLTFPTAAGAAARSVAWMWIALAAVVALVVAMTASWFVSRRIVRPLVRLAAAARAIAAGDRTARSRVEAPGELGELATAFDTMADQVARAEAARRNLTADVAHELRTPLAAVQAGLEELRDGLVPADPQRLTSLHDQALRLGRVVDDLSELSAAETAGLSLRAVDLDLSELAASVVRAHDARLRAAGLEIRTELADGVTVHADPDRLHQAIGNLLDNAARYGRPGDEVTVRVRSTSGWAVVEVTDTGPGIPADELPHVFDRLWRGSAATGVAGSGIGLAVVHELATAHGGNVTAAATTAGGTTFTIRLPSGDLVREEGSA
jgi:two-component system sensor histidine kinase BaeS